MYRTGQTGLIPFLLVVSGLLVLIGVTVGSSLPGTVEIPNPVVGGDGEVRCDLTATVEIEGAEIAKEPRIDGNTFDVEVSRSGVFSGSIGSTANLLAIVGQDNVVMDFTLSGDNILRPLSSDIDIGDLGAFTTKDAQFKATKLPPGTYDLGMVLTWDNSEPLDLSSGRDEVTKSVEVAC